MARGFAKAFYNTRAWADARDYCMMRDHFTCQLCGLAAEEVHHIIHLSPENINNPQITLNPDNLICLCHDCHMKQHGYDRHDYPYEFDSNGQLVEKKIFR